MSNFSYLATLYYINVPKYLQFLNFLNFAEDDDDQKRLVGLRQASGRRQKGLRLDNRRVFLVYHLRMHAYS